MAVRGKTVLIRLLAAVSAASVGWAGFEACSDFLAARPAAVRVTADWDAYWWPDDPEPGGRLVLNEATDKELQSLPGVGKTLAARIIAYRDAAGGFTSAEELTRVQGIGEATLANLLPLVWVPPPQPE